jgi:Holliday junction DNA helicase RuvA
MIAYLTGKIVKKELKALIVDVQGIGYRVFCPLGIVASIEINTTMTLHTHQHIREDESSLYGFRSEAELHFFEKLITVSGIGPKSALEIMDVPLHLVQNAIVSGDVDFLKSLKGIGKKTAERLIIELRGNLPPLLSSQSGVPPEVIAALTDLGFDRLVIEQRFQELKITEKTPEEMVRLFLQKSAF